VLSERFGDRCRFDAAFEPDVPINACHGPIAVSGEGYPIKSAQGVPEETAKQLDAKNQILAKQVQSLDGRLQAQANAIKAMSTIMQKVQGNLTDTNGLKREMEALARIQKDRQTAESQASAQASAATLQAAQQAAQQAAAAARQKEKMVQYPRAQAADAQAAGSGGVVSVKP
jgi:peptidoglycan hydrolase CwlO-like protein